MSYTPEEVARILSVRWRVGFSDGSGNGDDGGGAWIVTERRVIRRNAGEQMEQGVVVYAGGEYRFMGVSSGALAREIVAQHNDALKSRKLWGRP